MGNHSDLVKQSKNEQLKYTYYIVGLNIASIAFSINQTMNTSLNWTHYILGLSIACWSISVYSGLFYIKIMINLIKNNALSASISEGVNPLCRNLDNLERDEIVEDLYKDMEKMGSKISMTFNRQSLCFYLGIIFFIIWHVIKMSQYIEPTISSTIK